MHHYSADKYIPNSCKKFQTRSVVIGLLIVICGKPSQDIPYYIYHIYYITIKFKSLDIEFLTFK